MPDRARDRAAAVVPLHRVTASWLGLTAAVAIISSAILASIDYGFPDATALAGLGIAAVSLAIGRPSGAEPTEHRTPAWLLPVSAGMAIVPLIPLALHSGMPAMQHDWRWPLESADVRRWWPQHLSAWDDAGWGNRTAQPGLDPAIGLISLLAYILSAKMTLIGLLFLSLAVGSYGAAVAVSPLVRSPAVALVAIAAYAANPVVINKLGAGHTLFFVAYATVPWLFLIMSGPLSPVRRATLGGMLIGLSAVQPQFIAYNGLVAAAGAIAGSGRSRGIAAFCAIMLGVVTAAPLIAANMGGSPAGFRSPTTQWEITLSSLPAQAIGWDGYFGQYFRLQAGRFAAFPYVLLTAAGLSVAWGTKQTRALAILMLVGFVIVIGFAGPWEHAFAWVFLAIPAAAAFRELYHAAPLIAFSGSILGAFAVDRSRYAGSLAVAAAGALILVAFLAAPWKLPSYHGHSVISEVASVVDPRGASVASLPLTHPVGEPPHYGLDPSAWSKPGIAAYWVYEPTQPGLAVGTAFECGDPALATLLRRANVQYALVHRRWRSGAAVTPSIPLMTTAICLLPAGVRYVGSTNLFRTISGDQVAQFGPTSNGGWIGHRLPTTTRIDDRCENTLPEDFMDAGIAAEDLAVDARTHWVPARPYYLEHPEFAYAPAVGVYTRSTRVLTLSMHPGPTWFLLWSYGAAANDAHDREIQLATAGHIVWRRIDAGQQMTIQPTGPTVIFGWSAKAPVAHFRRECDELPVRWTRLKPTEWSANLPHAPGTVVFRQSFDSGWVLWLDNKPVREHFMVDGYANGWYVPARSHGAATITYVPQSRLNVLLAASGLAWLICIAGLVLGMRSSAGVPNERKERLQ